MSDFDLLNDAENFEDECEEPDVPDDFLPKEIESKKRVLDNDNSSESNRNTGNDKRVKPAGCLSDYFVDNNVSQLTQKSSQGGNNDFTKQSDYGANKNGNGNTSENTMVEEKGPLCACGTSSISKTTFKDGPNKDRKFWVCGSDRDSQCKFFEWRDALNSFDSDATNQQQQSKSAGPNGSEEEKGPQCSCGTSSISKTTFKEGPNKDRKFWVCGSDRDSQCKFFEWRDTPKSQPQNMSFNAGNQQQQQPASSGPNCKCGIPGVSRTTTKEGPNKGKAFWVCSAQQGSQCKFFEWSVPEGQNNQGGSANNNNNYGNNNNGGNNNNYGSSSNNNSNYGNNNNGNYGNNGGNNNNGNNTGNNNGNYGNNGGNNNGYGNNGSNNSGSNTQKSGTCYKCGEAGHWSTNCPKQGGGGGGYKNGGQGGGGYKKY